MNGSSKLQVAIKLDPYKICKEHGQAQQAIGKAFHALPSGYPVLSIPVPVDHLNKAPTDTSFRNPKIISVPTELNNLESWGADVTSTCCYFDKKGTPIGSGFVLVV
ncbi:hypothetical protein ACA910_006962 [Epithemia clementina (nom. ined.)]